MLEGFSLGSYLLLVDSMRFGRRAGDSTRRGQAAPQHCRCAREVERFPPTDPSTAAFRLIPERLRADPRLAAV